MAARRRRPKGRGSVYKDPHRDTWFGQVRVDGTVHRIRATSKVEARGKLDALLRGELPTPDAVVTAGVPAGVPAGVTVGQLADGWRRRLPAPPALAPSTISRHRWACGLITEVMGHLPATTVRVADIEQALEILAGRGLSSASLVQVRSTLRQVFADAERREVVNRNPVDGDIRIPRDASRAQARRALTPEDASRLLEVLRSDHAGLPYLLQLRLGLRPGEAFALHWESIDLDAATLTVSRGIQRNGGKVQVVDTLKVETARRTLRIPADVVEVLRRYRATATGPMLFTTTGGHPVDGKAQRRMLTALCDRAEVPRLTPNELRHTAASLLLDSGAPIEQVADLLGHTTVRMLDRTYRHRVRPAVEVAAAVDWASPTGGR